MAVNNDGARRSSTTAAQALLIHRTNYYLELENGVKISSHHWRRRRISPSLQSSTPSATATASGVHPLPYRSALFALIAICGIGSSSSSSLLLIPSCALFCPAAYLTTSSRRCRRYRSGGFSSSSISNYRCRHRGLSSKSTAMGSVTADYDTNNDHCSGGDIIVSKAGPSPTAAFTEIAPSSDVTGTVTTPSSSSTTLISTIINNNRSSTSSSNSSKQDNKNGDKTNEAKKLNNTNTHVNIDAAKSKNDEGNKRPRRRPSSQSSSFSYSPRRRPYADLSIDELRQLTEYHLSRNIRPDGSLSLGNMTPGQRHEFARLIASWSNLSAGQSKSIELSSPSPTSIMNANFTTATATKSKSANDKSAPSTVVSSLTGEETLLAAEMAEQCLRELIEEENAMFTSSVNTSPTSSSSAIITTPPDLYYLVIKARLDVGKGSGGGGYGHGRKGNMSYRDLRHATSLLDLMERQQRKRSPQPLGQKQKQKHKQREKQNLHLSSLLSVMKCYAVVLDRWCKTKMSGAEVKAEELLRRMMTTMTMTMMEHGYDGGDDDGREMVDEAAGAVLVRQYNNVMNRIATSGKPNAGVEAERLLYELIAASSLSSSSASHSLDTTPATTVTTITTSPFAARAPPLPLLAPDRISFNTVIKAYANAGGEHAVANAERILSVMENYRPSSSQKRSVRKIMNIVPDKISYTSVLMAYASSNGKRKKLDAGERAEELLERIIKLNKEGGGGGDSKPDTVMYNAVLKVWGKCGHPNAVERSERLLNKMLEISETGNPDIVPDDVTFNTVMHTIANSNTADSPRRAMALLERMEMLYESGLIVGAKPDIVSYNSVLDALAKSGGGVESARLAEEMLDDLEELYDSRRQRRRRQSTGARGGGGGGGGAAISRASSLDIRPDVYSYNIVIGAWANCGYANRAVSLLDRMTRQANRGRTNLQPDATTYNSVLHAWSQSSDRNAPVKALGLLEIMLRLRESGGGGGGGGVAGGSSASTTFPDVLSFSTVINAFSKSKYPRKARQSRDLLKRMKHLYETGGRREEMRPNVYVYSAVLNACAYTFGRIEEKEEALQIGIETYDELRMSVGSDDNGMKANHVAYGSFIRLCRRLMAEDDPRREELIATAFRDCCTDGQLGEYVLRQLRPVAGLYSSLLKSYIKRVDGDVRYEDLPLEWTCNVVEKNRSRSALGYAGLNRRK